MLCFLLFPGVSHGENTVGVIFSGNIAYYRSMHKAFLDELKGQGADEKVKYVVQFPAPDPVALSNAAKKLVVGGVDMIIAYGTPALKAVQGKESDVPTMYMGVYDPQNAFGGGKNITGCGYKVSVSSLLRYFKEVAVINRLVVIYNSLEEDSLLQQNELAKIAADQGIEMLPMEIRTRQDLKMLDDVKTGDSVFITGSTAAHTMSKDIMVGLLEKKVPAVDVFPDALEDGALIALYGNPDAQGRGGAIIAAQVFGGAKAGQVEPMLVNETELVFNFREARNLGLTFPSKIAGEATRVIE